MSFIVGTGTNLQVGKESTFGNIPALGMTQEINLTSEALKVTVEKGDEGSLLASKTAQTRDILAVNVDGNISFILKPEFAGRLFQAAMGGDDSVSDGALESGTFIHTINLCDPKVDLPSLTFTIDRGTGAKAYTGCTISSLSIDAAAGDYVKGSIDIKGKEETAGELAVLTPCDVPSYRCTAANFTIAGQTYCISSASFKIDNALEDAPKTYCSGVHSEQPAHGRRSVTIDFDIPYKAEVDTLKDTYLTDEKTAKVVLKFTSKDPNEYIEITMPNIAITDVTANVGGPGLINASVSGEALSVGATEPVTVAIQTKANKGEAY